MLRKLSLVESQMYYLIAVAFFQLMPLIIPSTVDYSFIIVFFFTFLFFIASIKKFLAYRNSNLFIRKNFFFILLTLWTIFILFTGLKFNYVYLRDLVISPYTFLPYLFPFIVRLYDYKNFSKLLDIIHIINIIYLILIATYFLSSKVELLKSVGFIEDLNKYFCFPNFLMLLSFRKINKKKKFISILVFIVGLLLSVLAARRSLTWTFGWALIISVFVNYFDRSSNYLVKLRFIFTFLFAGFFIYFGFDYVEKNLLGNLNERLYVDSRSTVIEDFNNDMSSTDMFLGRGIGGTYNLLQTDFIFDFDEQRVDERNIIESGYLNLVLYGGYLYVFLLAVVLMKAIYNGFFRSNNMLSKISASYILIFLIEAFPAGVMMFNIRFYILWFCVVLCWNSNVYQMEDQEIELELY